MKRLGTQTGSLVVFILLAAIGLTIPAHAQETAYVFSSKCFNWSASIGVPGQIVLKPNAPRECFDASGVGLSEQALSVVYTKSGTDQQVAALRTEINDLAAKALAAIKQSVADNSVKAGEIDALVKSIEDKLYERVLRRVKADLAAQPARPAGGRQ